MNTFLLVVLPVIIMVFIAMVRENNRNRAIIEENTKNKAIVEFSLYLQDPHEDNEIFTEIAKITPHFQFMVDHFCVEAKDGFIEQFLRYYTYIVVDKVRPNLPLAEGLKDAIYMLESVKGNKAFFALLDAKMKSFLKFANLGKFDISLTEQNIDKAIRSLKETESSVQ